MTHPLVEENNPGVVVDEFASAHELTRKIATSGLQNDAFLLANEDQLVANYNKWNTQFPKIQPYFGKFDLNKTEKAFSLRVCGELL